MNLHTTNLWDAVCFSKVHIPERKKRLKSLDTTIRTLRFYGSYAEKLKALCIFSASRSALVDDFAAFRNLYIRFR